MRCTARSTSEPTSTNPPLVVAATLLEEEEAGTLLRISVRALGCACASLLEMVSEGAADDDVPVADGTPFVDVC